MLHSCCDVFLSKSVCKVKMRISSIIESLFPQNGKWIIITKFIEDYYFLNRLSNKSFNQLLDARTPKIMKIVTSFYDQPIDTQLKKIILR